MNNQVRPNIALRQDLSRVFYHDVRKPLRELSNFAFLLHHKADLSSDSDVHTYCHYIERSVAQLNLRFSQLLTALNEYSKNLKIAGSLNRKHLR